MKLNINKNIIKRGLWYSSLTLMCLTTSGCIKKNEIATENNNDNTVVGVYELESIDNQDIDITLDNDTMKTLDKYNEYLKGKEINVNDLEVLSMYNVPMFVIKSEEENYSQISDDYYVATRKNGDIDILFSKIPDEAKYDMLTQEKLDENTKYISYTPVIEYMVNHDIESVGYILPKHIAYSDSDIHMIESIYGEDVVECVKELGLPLKVYNAKDFYSVNENKITVTKIKK